MKYAIKNNKKIKATQSGEIAKCPVCSNEVRAHCGKVVIWHWKHLAKKKCDPWWEPETPWHRDWKEEFPDSWQEVVLSDPLTGEKHIADIINEKNLVVEFQNSPISLNEILTRERFYRNIIWVINAIHFKSRFELTPFEMTEATYEKITKYEFILKNILGEVAQKITSGYMWSYVEEWVYFKIEGEKSSLSYYSDAAILNPIKSKFRDRVLKLSEEKEKKSEELKSILNKIKGLPECVQIKHNNQSYLMIKNSSDLNFESSFQYFFCETENIEAPPLFPFDFYQVTSSAKFNSLKDNKKYSIFIKDENNLEESLAKRQRIENELLKIESDIELCTQKIKQHLETSLSQHIEKANTTFKTGEENKLFILDWKRPKKAWLSSEVPVFFDTGEDYLYCPLKKDSTFTSLMVSVSKKDFVDYVLEGRNLNILIGPEKERLSKMKSAMLL